jgi:spermidine synthase
VRAIRLRPRGILAHLARTRTRPEKEARVSLISGMTAERGASRLARMDAVLLLVAYGCSGLAGLVYEVSWTRLLALALGHGVAASSTVLAAFMGGLAIGAAVGGRVASVLSARTALRAYAAIEATVALTALLLPFALHAAGPLFASAYADGAGRMEFGVVRLVVCLVLLAVPATGLGATFPLVVRGLATAAPRPIVFAGRLYAVNTIGAFAGAVLTGFVLLPWLGTFGSTLVGVAASVSAAIAAALLAQGLESDIGLPEAATISAAAGSHPAIAARGRSLGRTRPGRGSGGAISSRARGGDVHPQPFLAAALLAMTGLATFGAEVAWTRVSALLVGPSTYAFAATAAAFIGGTAIGAVLGTSIAARTRRPALAAGIALGLAAIAAAWITSTAGTRIPRAEMLAFAGSPDVSIVMRALLLSLTVVPMALLVGAAFPLSLFLAGGSQAAPATVGSAYAVNTLAAVAGSLGAGFLAVPALGLERTLTIVCALLAAGAAVAVWRSRTSIALRLAAAAPIAIALAILLAHEPWDRELLASGAYKYASAIAPGLDPETALKSGTLLYYRDGATATVSVKRVTGALSLAIDGKVDASTAGDMLTQKLLAHLPLLLHGDARTICIVGLGSGVTLASALTHPIDEADVLEISPEVVEASRLFARDGRPPLDDPRTRLIVADGRTHLALTRRRYDVIVSEPSNPWMAGVAALFTREFFEAARARLAEHGVICQWVNTYDISQKDLASIVATFHGVFPHMSMWLAGDGDLMLIGSADEHGSMLERLARPWTNTAVAADLRTVAVNGPFGVLSMFVGGNDEADRLAGTARVQTDDRMALEFSAPRALHSAERRENVERLRTLVPAASRPPAVARAWQQAGGDDLAQRAVMLRRTGAYEPALAAARDAIDKAPDNRDALEVLVESASALGRQGEATTWLSELVSRRPDLVAPAIALSKLHAAAGQFEAAVRVTANARQVHPDDASLLEQMASIFADAGDADRLGSLTAELMRHPERPGSQYYVAAHHFMRGDLDRAQSAARRAVALDPRFARAQNLLGAIYATRGDLGAARQAFQTALDLDSQDPATYQNLGLLELNTGNSDAAARLFSEALSLDPSLESARQGLTRARAVL